MGDKRKHTALLIIDMQKDFMDVDCPMLVKGGKAIVPNVVKAVQMARQRGMLVVWGPPVKGQTGAELVDGLVTEEGDYKLVKTRFSPFFATHLHSYLKSNGVDSLVVIANIFDMKNVGVALPTLQEWLELGA